MLCKNTQLLQRCFSAWSDTALNKQQLLKRWVKCQSAPFQDPQVSCVCLLCVLDASIESLPLVLADGCMFDSGAHCIACGSNGDSSFGGGACNSGFAFCVCVCVSACCVKLAASNTNILPPPQRPHTSVCNKGGWRLRHKRRCRPK